MIERSALRHTPAGLPALDIVIHHESVVQEQGVPRQVSMDIRAVCIGTPVASLQQLPNGRNAHFGGFLASARNGRGLVFHITALQLNP